MFALRIAVHRQCSLMLTFSAHIVSWLLGCLLMCALTVAGDTVSNMDLGPALAAHKERADRDKDAIMTMVRSACSDMLHLLRVTVIGCVLRIWALSGEVHMLMVHFSW
jgi:hypothetical protein